MKIRRAVSKTLNKLLPSETKMTILSGPAKGMKWIKGAGNNGHWIGTYEKLMANAFAEEIKEGDVVFDIGAHAGYYTLIASRVVGERGKVYSFEPAQQNINYLKEHVKINNCKNVEIVKMAVSNKKSKTYFDTKENSYLGKITKNKTGVEVYTTTIDDFVDDYKTVPQVIKSDVEGEESNVLSGGVNTLNKCHPTIFTNELCAGYLKSLGYKTRPLIKGEIIAFN